MDIINNNEQIILETLIKENKKSSYPDLSDNEYFNFYAAEQIMKDMELSTEELDGGIVDSSGDGGIDSIYIFVNQELIRNDTELIEFKKRNPKIDVFIIQAKNTCSFNENVIEKFNSSAIDIFDLSKTLEDLKGVYNADLLSNVDVFRRHHIHLASKFPILAFHYYYVTKGSEVHPNVDRKKNILMESIKKHFDNAEVNFNFITAKKLIELSRKEHLISKDVVLADNPISTEDGGYIALVPIQSYFNFITDENKNLIKYFFDANIRDYQGNVEINKGIQQTLKEQDSKEDFWWLNNGVTITALDATFASKKLHIEDPQVVNGLQTSFEIFNYFTQNKIETDKRNILLRVIKVQDEKSRLNVIKSTNSQTNIPPASMKATDPIHKDIEDYFLSKGYYYDRRKNYHKNQGKPVGQIIGIPYLAQVVTAILNQKPDYARARPSTLIKSAKDYSEIFNTNFPLLMYLNCVLIQKRVEQCLKSFSSPKLSKYHIGDIKFHVSMYVTAILSGKLEPSANDIEKIDLSSLSQNIIEDATECVYLVYEAMGGNNSVAKGTEFVVEVKEELRNVLKLSCQ